MLIKQSPEEIKQSLILNANVAIDAIRLSEANIWSRPASNFDPEEEMETEVRFRPGVIHRPEGVLVFTIDFDFPLFRLSFPLFCFV